MESISYAKSANTLEKNIHVGIDQGTRGISDQIPPRGAKPGPSIVAIKRAAGLILPHLCPRSLQFTRLEKGKKESTRHDTTRQPLSTQHGTASRVIDAGQRWPWVSRTAPCNMGADYARPRVPVASQPDVVVAAAKGQLRENSSTKALIALFMSQLWGVVGPGGFLLSSWRGLPPRRSTQRSWAGATQDFNVNQVLFVFVFVFAFAAALALSTTPEPSAHINSDARLQRKSSTLRLRLRPRLRRRARVKHNAEAERAHQQRRKTST
ncbi:hypothetical protein GGR50DRAFT_702105 [Xylaria sp. CBS 124048]|nr:hypothetical protein GGR50DRAFT_702105 [Xylaria sp. CBS 124048]